jgi:hypothetical protein
MTERKFEIGQDGAPTMGSDRHWYYIRINGKRAIGPPLAKADACLIAASPDLYAACEWLTNLHRGVGKSGDKPEPSEWDEAFASSEVALTKARGES